MQSLPETINHFRGPVKSERCVEIIPDLDLVIPCPKDNKHSRAKAKRYYRIYFTGPLQSERLRSPDWIEVSGPRLVLAPCSYFIGSIRAGAWKSAEKSRLLLLYCIAHQKGPIGADPLPSALRDRRLSESMKGRRDTLSESLPFLLRRPRVFQTVCASYCDMPSPNSHPKASIK